MRWGAGDQGQACCRLPGLAKPEIPLWSHSGEEIPFFGGAALVLQGMQLVPPWRIGFPAKLGIYQHDGGTDPSLVIFAGRGLRATAKITYQAVLLENVVCNSGLDGVGGRWTCQAVQLWVYPGCFENAGSWPIGHCSVLPLLKGVTLTLWSTCGLSRGGLYGEWQGVICTGENGSRVQVRLPTRRRGTIFGADSLASAREYFVSQNAPR